jgi:hypothetical protein
MLTGVHFLSIHLSQFIFSIYAEAETVAEHVQTGHPTADSAHDGNLL